MRPAARRDGGFTLVELLVVVIVIGVLAAVAVPLMVNQQRDARRAATQSDLAHAKQAIVGYAIDHADAVPDIVSDDARGRVTATGVELALLGWSKSPPTMTLVYRTTGSGAAARWCVDGTNETGAQYRVSSGTSVARGDCAALTSAKY